MHFRLQKSACNLLHDGFLLGLFFGSEDRGDKLSSNTFEAGVVGPMRVPGLLNTGNLTETIRGLQ
jgi:hypothetical protein